MAPDYDLSGLPTESVNLWIGLHVSAFFGQILADQAERLGTPLALGRYDVSARKVDLRGIFGNGLRGVDA
jgi:hypothetical protein